MPSTLPAGTSLVPFLPGTRVDNEGRAADPEQIQAMRRDTYSKQREDWQRRKGIIVSPPDRLMAD